MSNKIQIIKEYNSISLKHKIIYLNKPDFHQFINGFYQAEGTMGVYYSKIDSLRVRFLFSLGQNYSPEALNIFLNLKKILNVGIIKLEFNSQGKAHLRYNVSNTKDIFDKVLPYFSLLYGQKRKDLALLEKIYKLSFIYKNPNISPIFKSEFIHLVYATNPEGNQRKVSLAEKLNIFNCSSINYVNNFEIEENNNLPSKLFILGLFLGDGSLGFVFNSPPSRLPKFYVKIVFNFAAQSNTKYNIKLLELIAERLNLKPNISRRQSGMIGLEYTGEIVFKIILPFLMEYQDWLFWKKNQFIIAQKIAIIFKDKGHLTKNGLLLIVNLLYSIPNKYLKSKEFWINLINARYLIKHDCIQSDKKSFNEK